ncbi:hypothetical protein [Paractinoplanes lichenicola]|uniref:Uncharacterized protein n=1 Tax=Paractinoplanes lichenicola TaxID=2802976 RepID=A0ABS1VPD5_9ACTN|nr:hypothetical protein [Actinoplanes lichenicola]MBL7255376.1 hypothetical protein [Actinoplanes lichenicola]
MHPAVSPVPGPGPAKRNTTWWWFLVPTFTCGFGAFAMVFTGGYKLKSRAHMAAAVAYLVVTVGFACGAGLTAPDDPSADRGTAYDLAMAAFLLIVWLGGTLHTVFLQLKVAKQVPPPPAVAAAAWRVQRREEARELVRSNPGMAWELRIGRPDIEGRQYDDGGLVDVNHMPAAWLAYSLQIPQPLADEIALQRGLRQGFTSPDELVVYCAGMTPERMAMIRDLLLFRPL